MSRDGFDWVERADDLSKAAQSDAEYYALMAAELLTPARRLVVDFGCGGAGMAVALRAEADRRGFDVRVAGLDPHPEVYERARRENPRITFARASFEDGATAVREAAGGPIDLIWARGALHHAEDEQAALDTLAAALAPGGTLAVAEGGTTAAHMPRHLGVGEPGLHARLNAGLHENFRRKTADLKPMPYGWQTGLRKAGLENTTTRNVLFDRPAPLVGADLDFVLRKFTKQVDWAEEFLEPADLAAWRRLLDPDDTAWLGHRDDLFYLAAESVHIGHKPS